MFKRIRDYIYDINDIFIALMIIVVAVGIIVWRSTTIMAYPEYLAAKEAAANTVTPIDAPPSNTVDQNGVTINVTPNTGGENSSENTGESSTSENTAENDTSQNTADSQGGESQTGQGEDQSGQVQEPVVTADITIEFGFRGNWYTVADRIIDAGVLKPEARDAFYQTVLDIGLSRNLQIGTFTLSSDMSYEQMIKILCRKD